MKKATFWRQTLTGFGRFQPPFGTDIVSPPCSRLVHPWNLSTDSVDSVCAHELSGNFNSSNFNVHLLWFKGKLSNQMIDIMLDCGATVSCIAKRCVTGNPVLNKVPRLPYHGPPLEGANGQLLSALSIIHVPLHPKFPFIRNLLLLTTYHIRA